RKGFNAKRLAEFLACGWRESRVRSPPAPTDTLKAPPANGCAVCVAGFFKLFSSGLKHIVLKGQNHLIQAPDGAAMSRPADENDLPSERYACMCRLVLRRASSSVPITYLSKSFVLWKSVGADHFVKTSCEGKFCQ